VWQKWGCPARGWMWLEIWVKLLQTEIRDSTPSNRNCWRAPRERCRNAGGKKDPRVFFICTKGGRGGAEPGPAHVPFPKSSTRLNFLAKFFGKKFWK